jgi:hypothetical protein
MLVTLGYPADDAADVEHDRKVRRPVEEIVHYGSFDPVDETDVTPGTTVAEQADD